MASYSRRERIKFNLLLIGATEKNKAVKLNKEAADVMYFYTGWSETD